MKRILGMLFALGALTVHANLLVNGDFEAGNTGFSTFGYVLESPFNGENRYTIDTANPWAGQYGVLADHTSGSGNYMSVNGSDFVPSNDFWIQSVDVVAGVEYTFSGYIANLTVSPLPTIQLEIDGATFANNTFTLANAAVEWNSFSFSWTADATDTVSLSLNATTGDGGGNDFGIDDLAMIPEPATMGLVAMFGCGIILVRRLF